MYDVKLATYPTANRVPEPENFSDGRYKKEPGKGIFLPARFSNSTARLCVSF